MRTVRSTPQKTRRLPALALGLAAGLLLAAFLFIAAPAVLARPALRPARQLSPLHPVYVPRDAQGQPVIESGAALSTIQTCGACHDAGFIEQHSFHAQAGLDEQTADPASAGLRPWEFSPGLFGGWDPLTYRRLSQPGDSLPDLTTPAWIMTLGLRHTGGGPAVASRSGQPLAALPADAANPETSIVDSLTGAQTAWDWGQSGVVEMNCFLCHTPAPNNAARQTELRAGRFAWANTATLVGSGIVESEPASGVFTWNPAAFEASGELKAEFVKIQDPTNENCGQCHGLVQTPLSEPVAAAGCIPAETWRTATTGQVVSGERIVTDLWSEPQRTILTGQVISGEKLSESGMNLADKESLSRPWDIHAERLVDCTGCHYSLNNPVYYLEQGGSKPDHLTFDPRRIDLGEYLQKPLHQFARGQSAQSGVAEELKGSMRRCESCHSIEATHDWLPYKERHTQALACESCHAPQMYTSALQSADWTVISINGEPAWACRGLGDSGNVSAVPGLDTLIKGYQPALLSRPDVDGNNAVAPYNLISAWYWVAGDPPVPVRQQDLRRAWLEEGRYPAEIMAAFDADANGSLEPQELRIDSDGKQQVIAGRLAALGLSNPHIEGEVQPYSINHNIAAGEWAVRDCRACHGDDSRLAAPMELAAYVPGGVLPQLPAANKPGAPQMDGSLEVTASGALVYRPAPEKSGLYVLGHNRAGWVDWFGGFFFLATLLGVAGHGGLRLYAALRQPKHSPALRRVYMYGIYERLWHWLQTAAILLLLFTGLIIHRPDMFGIFSFRYVVLVHNVLAAVLVINAGLSLFYHLASGEIKQFIPRPRGFFDDAIVQGLFYLRGIFSGKPHPFEKTPEKKLNPLQQATYFGLLNVLLPLQIITGALMWGVQRWPELAASLGGLPLLGPLHSLVAWMFGSFIVGHVYLTTTGHKPLAAIQAMMHGWDEVEAHAPPEEIPAPVEALDVLPAAPDSELPAAPAEETASSAA